MKSYVNLKIIKNECFYTQNSQQELMRMSLLKRIDNKSFEEMHYGVTCREFFGDTLLFSNADIDGPRVYGLKLKVRDRQALDETIISLFIDSNKRVNFIKGLKFVREAEKLMGIPVRCRTKCYHIEAQREFIQNRLVIVGPKEWQHSPVLLSFYSLFLRVSLAPRDASIKTIKEFFNNPNITATDRYLGSKLTVLDLDIFFKNYKEIFGEDRLTGINDSEIISKIRDISYLEANNTFNITLSLTEEEHGVNKNCNLGYGLYENHTFTGITTFLNRIDNITIKADDKNKVLDYLIFDIKKGIQTGYLGLKWVIKYLMIKERECLRNI